jgi:hypothetical protein
MPNDAGTSAAGDAAFEEVWEWLQGHPRRANDGLDLEAVFARAVRKAIDEVIDGARTGRFTYKELEPQEKTYIGTRIEIVVRTELDLLPEGKLDTEISGHPVDFKWSAKGNWMIPREAVGEMCLVLSGDESGGTFSVGLVRCLDERLNPGSNQDAKRTLSKEGKSGIRWLVDEGELPTNFLAALDPDVRAAILAKPPGQARVREFFTLVTGVPVPREVIPTLAIQEDPMRRIRQDKSDRLGGMKVLSGHFEVSRRAAQLLGYELTKRDYLSVPTRELIQLPANLRADLKLKASEDDGLASPSVDVDVTPRPDAS